MARVAIDAMGGDHAPREIVRGAVAAAESDPTLEQILVGVEDKIRAELPRGEMPRGVSIVHAADVLEMHESPVEALRRKQDTSIVRCMKLVLEKRADAVVSAGNTGGVVAAATFLLPRLPNCRRAGIAVPFPTRTGHCVLMDVGANIQCKPVHLVQYALMAREYAREVCGIDDPRVALLSVGGEEGKGNPLVKDTFAAMKAVKGLRFTGNVEGQQIFSGEVDVVVCEGFVGNVVLKMAEGMTEVMKNLGEYAFKRKLLWRIGLALLSSGLKQLKTVTDYREYGGAPFLGFSRIVIKAHGRSSARAIANAIKVAAKAARDGVPAEIERSIQGFERRSTG